MTTKNKFFFMGAHVIFCALLVYWFYNNSYIRPYAINQSYKEIISALLLLSVIYLNYFFVAPYFLRKSEYKNYFICSLLLVVTYSFIELLLLKNNILRCFTENTSFDINRYLFYILFVVFLRNAGFYLFFTVLKLYQQTKDTALLEKKEALKNEGLVLFVPLKGKPITLNIKSICYFSHKKNFTLIHDVLGEVTATYSTLNNVQEYLGDYCLRISKEYIITFTNIINYNENNVVVRNGKTNIKKSFPYSKNDAENILNTLRANVPDLEEKKSIYHQKNQNGGIKDDEKIENVGIRESILEEIRKNPGINVTALSNKIDKKVASRTIERKLEELKKAGIIKFEGSRKFGGYHLI